MAHDVFISYSSKDKHVADAMCNKLESNGIRCWIAPRDIRGGMDWGGAIMQAIKNSQLMVLVFSSSANASKPITHEVERAMSKGVMVVPFRIEDVQPSDSLEFYLGTSHWLDALPPPVEQHLQRLVEDVKELMRMLPEKRVVSDDDGMTLASVEEKIEAELHAIRAREVEAAGHIAEEAARRRDEEREQERREAQELRRAAEVAAVVEAEKRAAEEIERRPAAGPVPAKMTNSVGVEFVGIPPGSFMMGSENSPLLDRLLFNDTKPVHQVTIREGFYMGKYEVTQAQWQQVMGNNPADFKGDNLPVERVSWNDAIEFIAGLNAQNDGYTYRLPSEAEWEYACRAGTTGEYAGDLDSMAWYSKVKNSFKPIEQTRPVGSKLPNAFGLFDMHGNVWEWCQDWYHRSYTGAPANGSAWLSGGKQKHRVARGGSFFHYASGCRSAYRFKVTPGDRANCVGFRVVAVGRS
jgi:formylglycine-generating enzyme required for sulfatase activity